MYKKVNRYVYLHIFIYSRKNIVYTVHYITSTKKFHQRINEEMNLLDVQQVLWRKPFTVTYQILA